MNDTKENESKEKMMLKPSRPATKLQLSRPVNPRAKGAGGITVEVKKIRSAPRRGEEGAAATASGKFTSASAEELAALSHHHRTDTAVDTVEAAVRSAKGLTSDEKEARIRALQTAAIVDEEEKKTQEEQAVVAAERRKQRDEHRRQEEALKELQSAALDTREAGGAASAGESRNKRKKRDDELEDEEKSAGRKRKRSFRSIVEDEEEFHIKDIDTEEIFTEVEEFLSADGLAAGIGGEVEDYSEEEDSLQAERGEQHFSVGGQKSQSGIVKAIKGSERAIVAVPDIGRVKKGLRSEARVNRPAEKRTAMEQAQAFFERKLAETSKKTQKTVIRTKNKPKREKIALDVVLPEQITVADLANRMAVRAVEVIKELMKMGVMATPSQLIDADTAELLVAEFGHRVKRITEADAEREVFDGIEREDHDEDLAPRPPVVTVMGHVDHGKTSLLDALRSTDVVAGEAGGITQHIGAYQVTTREGQVITFLDTPGHGAFAAMRARGAQATDIVVLVVAADDGIMEQTQEAISHAKAAEVPIIVAINKIDKPGADPQRIKSELMNYELVPEEFGGDTICVEISALQKLHLDKLVEAILLQAEVLELRANPGREAAGVVLESRMEKGRGVIATLLVQNGSLRKGDIVLAGTAMGRMRVLMDDKGRQLAEAGPAVPVEVLGFDEAPAAGEPFAAVESEKVARDIIVYRQKKALEQKGAKRLSLEELFASGEPVKELPVIVKADVHGSAEAIINSLQNLGQSEVRVNTVYSGVGAISESDVDLAITTNAIILAFNVRAPAQVKRHASESGVDIRYYSVIYNLVDEIKAALSGMLEPTIREELLGYAEIKQVFSLSGKGGKVAGCIVTEGMAKRGAKARLLRDNVVIHEGELKTLRRFKEDVKEVREGYECGMAFEKYNDIREGDTIELFELVEEKRSL